MAIGFSPAATGDMQQAIVHHPEQNVALLAVVLARIFARHGERIVEGALRSLEAHAMPGEVGRRLLVVPLEVVVVLLLSRI
jgi:hypothetical protein